MRPKVSGLVEKYIHIDDITPIAELGEKDPDHWWNTFEVNVRGVYNTVRYVFVILSLPRIGA